MKALVLTSDIIMLVRWVITGITTVYFAYEILIGLFAFLPLKKPKKKFDRVHNFAVIISARNETNVIGYLLDSLQTQNYPKEHFDIFVIADNCTDNTASFARSKGAMVYERHNTQKATKGYALGWMFDILLKDYSNRYDAFCVFDADNIVDKDFLLHMNEQLCAGVEISQGYRDSKNPSDSWVSGNYALYFWTNIRFYQIARYNLGLSCMVGGTGFMFKTEVIADGGWSTATICEDVEFSLNKIAEGYKIGFAYDAKFYDEQPVTFRQSWTQRMRWTSGNVMCIAQCMPPLLHSKAHKPLQIFDSIMFLFAIPAVIGGLISTVLDVLARLLNLAVLPEVFPALFLLFIFSYLVTFAQGAVVVLAERKPFKTVYKGVLTYPVFMASWALVSFWGTLKQETKWKPIAHNKAMSIEQIKNTSYNQH